MSVATDGTVRPSGRAVLDYALNIPFVFSSNGDGFVFHGRTGASNPREVTLGLEDFPSPAELWACYRSWKCLDAEAEQIVLQDYYEAATTGLSSWARVHWCSQASRSLYITCRATRKR